MAGKASVPVFKSTKQVYTKFVPYVRPYESTRPECQNYLNLCYTHIVILYQIADEFCCVYSCFTFIKINNVPGRWKTMGPS